MKPLESIDAIKRESGTRSVKKKIFIICEGVQTEPNYFRTLKEYVDVNDISLPEIVVLQRYSIQYGHSDPLRIVKLTNDYFRMLKTGKYSEQLFIGKLIDSTIRYKQLDDIQKNNLAKKLISILKDNDLLINDLITDIDSSFELCCQHICETFEITDFTPLYDQVYYDQ